ncbi:MutS N-terminal domain-containing protein [Prevotella sp.]|uniref:zincin-like metallopeptidase domain-containing protein n=1 Tax=Prevotella sp. TaxID=59823 RepID=UPI003AB93E87
MAEEVIQKKTGAERQAAFLVTALERASEQNGVLLNGTKKQKPRFFDKGLRVNPVNALIMAIHSDMGGYKTNSYVQFNDTKNRGEAIRKGEKGVPFLWTNTSEYVNKDNAEDKISRESFKALSESEQAQYKPSPKEDVYVLFNIDQTTMPNVHKEDYNKQVQLYGGAASVQDTSYMDKEDKAKRISVNQFILNMRDNLVPIRKDATGIAHYDPQRDTVYVPAQKGFPTYADYVQEVARQVVHATGVNGRLNRDGGTALKESLVEELASAVKMLDFGMPAKLRPETMKSLPEIIEKMKEDPQLAQDVLREVNRTVGMIKKAENGEKIQIIEKPTDERQQQWASQFPIAEVPEKFSAITMLKDNEGKWTLAMKTDNNPLLAVHPSKEDVSLYFDVIKNDHDEAHVQEFRTQMAQKYYSLLGKSQAEPVNLFKSEASQEALDLISKVNAFKTKDSKILLVATIGDEKQKPRYVSQEQWQRLWLADDKQDYKKHLAAALYSDVLASKLEETKERVAPEVDGTKLHEEQEHRTNQQEATRQETEKKEQDKRRNSPEQKEKERQAEKAKEEATKQETKAVAAIALSPMMKQFMDLKSKHPDALLLFRVGDFYETYQNDARKAANVLGITLTKSSKSKGPDGKPLEMAGFPHHALDTYLPKLIRAGERVAICDQLEDPRKAKQSNEESQQVTKQEVKEIVSPGKKQEEEQHRSIHR